MGILDIGEETFKGIVIVAGVVDILARACDVELRSIGGCCVWRGICRRRVVYIRFRMFPLGRTKS
jgi:hypothetical protein